MTVCHKKILYKFLNSNITIANLLGRFSVWAASADAAFLHGRFVWASWDIDEFRELKPKILDDPGFLKLGLLGTASFDFPTFLQTQLCKEH
jgi:hypothetical protein